MDRWTHQWVDRQIDTSLVYVTLLGRLWVPRPVGPASHLMDQSTGAILRSLQFRTRVVSPTGAITYTCVCSEREVQQKAVMRGAEPNACIKGLSDSLPSSPGRQSIIGNEEGKAEPSQKQLDTNPLLFLLLPPPLSLSLSLSLIQYYLILSYLISLPLWLAGRKISSSLSLSVFLCVSLPLSLPLSLS